MSQKIYIVIYDQSYMPLILGAFSTFELASVVALKCVKKLQRKHKNYKSPEIKKDYFHWGHEMDIVTIENTTLDIDVSNKYL